MCLPRLPRLLAAGVLLLVVALTVLLGLRQADAGPVLDTVPVGRIPAWVGVDARTNRVFVSNVADHTVSVLDARSGAVLRTIALGHEPDTLAVDEQTGRVVVLSDPTWTADVLDATTGTLLRTMAVPGALELAVDDQSGRVLVTGPDPAIAYSTVAVLDGRTGTVLRQRRVSDDVTQPIAVDGRTQRAFVTDFDGGAEIMVDAASGRALRTVTVGSDPVQAAVDTLRGRVFVMNESDGTVSVLDARSGAVLRTVTVGSNPARAVVDARSGRVFVVHGRGIAANPYVGSLGVVSTFIGSGVTMLDARTGAVLGQIPVGGSPVDDIEVGLPVNLAVDRRRGRVFVIDAPPASMMGGMSSITFADIQTTAGGRGIGPYLTDQIIAGAANSPLAGSVSVLDAHSGHLLHTLRVGRHPFALAVDEATARLFVVNTNTGCVPPPSLWDRVPAAVRRVLPFLFVRPKPRCHLAGSVTVIDTSRL